MRSLIAGLFLALASLASAQVVVLTGKAPAVRNGEGETLKSNTPLVLVIDLSPAADPANRMTVLAVEMQDGERELFCDNLSAEAILLHAHGARGSTLLGMAIMGLESFGMGEIEGEFLLVSGLRKTIRLGKDLPTFEFATSLNGPRGYFHFSNGANDEIETGTVSFRLDTKATKLANTPVAGVVPDFASTVARHRALLASKYKISADRIGACD